MIDRPAETGIRDRILEGANPELRRLAAQGLVPLPPGELVAVQVELALSGEDGIAEVATAALKEMDARILASTIDEETSAKVLRFLGLEIDHPTVLEVIVRHRRVSTELLAEMAPGLAPEVQEILVLRQDAILEHPAILDSLERNPRLSRESSRRIREYRQHLLGPGARVSVSETAEEPVAGPESVTSPPAVAGDNGLEDSEVSDDVLQQALLDAREEPGEGDFEPSLGLSEGQIRTLPTPVRMRLARGARREVRTILVRDRNARVAVEVVRGNTLGDSEVENICQNRMICEEVLSEIANDRKWVRKYGVIRALTKNPRTPLPIALRLVPRLATRDLRALSRDRNVAEAVRKTARRTFAAKHG